MNEIEFNSVQNLSAQKRYKYFIKKIVDSEEIWGLYKEGWAIAKDNNSHQYLLFWPKKEFAEANAVEMWSSYIPMSISLNDFIEKWAPGMSKDNIYAAIFYMPQNNGVIIEANMLLKDIKLELDNY